jgi:hypothetical protein
MFKSCAARPPQAAKKSQSRRFECKQVRTKNNFYLQPSNIGKKVVGGPDFISDRPYRMH